MTEFQNNERGILVPSSKIAVAGKYHGQIIRAGKVIDEWEDPNIVVNEGLNALLNIMFNGTTQITTWYLGIYEGSATPQATWNASNIASSSTEILGSSVSLTGYTSTTRPEFVEAASSAQSLTNSASRASFVFNATKTVNGAFLISNSTKGGTTGTLFSAAAFGTGKSVVSGDELLLTYTFTASSV